MGRCGWSRRGGGAETPHSDARTRACDETAHRRSGLDPARETAEPSHRGRPAPAAAPSTPLLGARSRGSAPHAGGRGPAPGTRQHAERGPGRYPRNTLRLKASRMDEVFGRHTPGKRLPPTLRGNAAYPPLGSGWQGGSCPRHRALCLWDRRLHGSKIATLHHPSRSALGPTDCPTLNGGASLASAADGKGDPWKGSDLARITPHWSNPMKETKPGN
jgi:hypothetical protein